MLARLVIFAVPTLLLTAPAAADEIAGTGLTVGASAGFSASFSANVAVATVPVLPVPAPMPVAAVPAPAVIAVPAPAPVVAMPVAAPAPVVPAIRIRPRPAPIIIQPAPAPIVIQPAPPVVVVRPVPAAPPPTVVVAAPACGVCPAPSEASLGWAAEVEDEDVVDLLAFGRYRNVFGEGELGGGDFAVRLLLTDELSLEGRLAYLAGGTETGGNYEEAPLDLSLLWYPWERDFPVYFGLGAGFAWASRWVEGADPYDPGFWGAPEEVWFVGARAAVGLEIELWDFLLLTAETEFFYHATTEEADPDGGAGVSVDLGLGIRI